MSFGDGGQHGGFQIAGVSSPGSSYGGGGVAADLAPNVITTIGYEGVYQDFAEYRQGASSLNTWTTANVVEYLGLVLPNDFTFSKFYWENGATVSGNVDVGLYASDGTRIVSVGSTAQAGVSTLQTVTVAPTTLTAGVFYFLAMVMDNTVGLVRRFAPTNPNSTYRPSNIWQQAATFPLPASAVFGLPSNSVVPVLGITDRAVI